MCNERLNKIILSDNKQQFNAFLVVITREIENKNQNSSPRYEFYYESGVQQGSIVHTCNSNYAIVQFVQHTIVISYFKTEDFKIT